MLQKRERGHERSKSMMKFWNYFSLLIIESVSSKKNAYINNPIVVLLLSEYFLTCKDFNLDTILFAHINVKLKFIIPPCKDRLT